jgi:hypothetical protein
MNSTDTRQSKTLATAQTLERLQRYVNEFWYSENYRIDPETLALYVDRGESRAPAPQGFNVERWRTGYRFVQVRS